MASDHYPGSNQVRRLVRATPPEPDEPEEPTWKDFHRDFIVGGESQRFYTIRALAVALGGRTPTTIRKWERKGWIPAATFRTSGVKQDRLYTEQQIEGLVALAKDEGLMDPHKRVQIKGTSFPARATELFEALAASAQ